MGIIGDIRDITKGQWYIILAFSGTSIIAIGMPMIRYPFFYGRSQGIDTILIIGGILMTVIGLIMLGIVLCSILVECGKHEEEHNDLKTQIRKLQKNLEIEISLTLYFIQEALVSRPSGNNYLRKLNLWGTAIPHSASKAEVSLPWM